MNKDINTRTLRSYVPPRCEVYRLPELNESVMNFGGSDGTIENYSNEMSYDEDSDDWLNYGVTWDN